MRCVRRTKAERREQEKCHCLKKARSVGSSSRQWKRSWCFLRICWPSHQLRDARGLHERKRHTKSRLRTFQDAGRKKRGSLKAHTCFADNMVTTHTHTVEAAQKRSQATTGLRQASERRLGRVSNAVRHTESAAQRAW